MTGRDRYDAVSGSATNAREGDAACADTCGTSHYFPTATGCRAATVSCHLASGHAGAHEAIKGTTAYTWRDA